MDIQAGTTHAWLLDLRSPVRQGPGKKLAQVFTYKE